LPVEELLGGVLRFAGRVLFEFFVEVVLEVVCHKIGRSSLRTISLRKYPPKKMTRRQEHLCTVVGLAILVLVFGLTGYVLVSAYAA